ncbi:hypothetical protein [Rhodococcoides kyotonense]|uniref:Uncharacterized protein n=1 Tax=Rhodococcoides kyotonense TaxID=398843 RepID=A0A177Y7C5_9NOCA|nr:hypothetical protein [Rhodococcus kyotonensis]OAK51422.1 hypothetical protein A3K89_12610 [Rhodococcus kyotonensis]
MKIALALRELHRSEAKLTRILSTIAARHRVEPEVHHVALDIRGWSIDHLAALAEHGRHYELDLDAEPRTAALGTTVQEQISTLLGRRPEPALVLLMDLRHLHRAAAGVSLDWELLAQGAQAVGDTDLIDLCQRCHPDTLRQMRWANGMLKTLSPQVLAS